MAYTSGIFHINLVSGSDAARTALASCTASNPAGSTTRINKTAHGLVTGAVVDATLFTAWLNGAWKITVVDANNFDLDTAVWQATADASGTITPRGGANWTDAWLTTNAGATAARIQPGDEIRYAKTAEPTSIGQSATWTDNSNTVTLTTAITKKIEDAISGWTASANITLSTNASRKIGATAMVVTPAAGFTTGKVCYRAIAGGGTQDFSGYTHVSFFMRPTSASVIASGTYELRLCSDAIGAVAVNTLTIPALVAATSWQMITISTAGLGASIQSVAIYAAVDPGTTAFSINNIFAHNSTFSLSSLIGPSSTDCYYNIQSVDGTTIKIDSNNVSVGGEGWSGTTGTTTTYIREPFNINIASGYWSTMNEAGNGTNAKSVYSGGWDTGTNTQVSETVIGNLCGGAGQPFNMLTYTEVNSFVFARFTNINLVNNVVLRNIAFVGGAIAISNTTLLQILIIDCKIYNMGSVNSITGQVVYDNLKYYNNSAALTVGSGILVVSSEFRNNTSNSLTLSFSLLNEGSASFRNCILSDATEFSIGTTNLDSFAWSFDHDNTAGNHWGFTYGATINWQTTTKQGSDPGAWMVIISNSARNNYEPVKFKIAEVACAASALVTFKAWVKKDHATNVAASIYVEDEAYNIDGVVASETTKANDTNWEELTLTFTPTGAGVVSIYAKAWYVAGNSNAYFGSITVTQA